MYAPSGGTCVCINPIAGRGLHPLSPEPHNRVTLGVIMAAAARKTYKRHMSACRQMSGSLLQIFATKKWEAGQTRVDSGKSGENLFADAEILVE